ncbi:MAG: saccharopine dehydrogenase NADP-binding domain-containing protein [Chloroflexi bacterium]|nr:saccharopine dehydrogenase NADP-binding domain-containing protein [Chloroflexota bacterium]
MNILILGGYGYTGKLLAKHLLAETKHKIIIAGRHLDKAQTFVDELHDSRATAQQVDAADESSLKQALRGVEPSTSLRPSFLLVATPTTHHTETVICAALEAGVDYLDVQYSFEKLKILNAHAKEIQERNLCFITEAGFHPGLPAALIRYAASKMDCIESAATAGYLNVGTSMPYTDAIDELMEAFVDYQMQVYKNGKWTKSTSYDICKFDFGEDIGKRDCYSMFFEELRGLPEMYPGLKDVGFYMAGGGWLADSLTMLVLLGLKLAPKRGLKPMGKLMWYAMTKLPKPPYRVVLAVEAKGQLNGKPIQVRVRCEHEDGYEFTAIPVVAFLMQYGKVRRAGLHMMGHLAEPHQLFDDMQKMGVKVIESI